MGWALLAGLLALYYAPFLREALRPNLSEADRARAPGRFADLPRGRTHYRWHGPPDSQVIICIHGLTTPSFVWTPIAEGLAAQGFRVLTYDHYGRGYSDRPRGAHDLAFYNDHLSALLDHLGVTAPVTLFGYSMGGAIAASFAAAHPDRTARAILLAPAGLGHDLGGVARIVARRKWLGRWLMLASYAGSYRAALEEDRALATPALPDVVDLQLKELDYRGFIPAVWSSLYHALDHDLFDEHRRIAAAGTPLTAIWAADDDIIPVAGAEKLAALNPAATNVVIENATHAVAYTHPSDVLNTLPPPR